MSSPEITNVPKHLLALSRTAALPVIGWLGVRPLVMTPEAQVAEMLGPWTPRRVPISTWLQAFDRACAGRAMTRDELDATPEEPEEDRPPTAIEQVMELLGRVEKPMSQAEMAQELGFSTPTISRVMIRLVRAGRVDQSRTAVPTRYRLAKQS